VERKENNELKTGIAYFSKTGNTKVVAEYLAKELDAKLIRLEENKNYQGLGGLPSWRRLFLRTSRGTTP